MNVEILISCADGTTDIKSRSEFIPASHPVFLELKHEDYCGAGSNITKTRRASPVMF